ncbi:zinc knuckle [Ancylostoma caninum]|uniref:Zinc knuckle n=1 Tax=Ancylostoma caninum TaxID=29170 RepID=A0A368GXC3_ANCCA|nr:zinc knuckle [Ancylostoma caninum]
MSEMNSAEGSNGENRGEAIQNEDNEVENVASQPQEVQEHAREAACNWKEAMSFIIARCDSALLDQARKLSNVKRKTIVASVQCAVNTAIAAIERDNEAHSQLRTFLDAVGLKPQQVVEMLPRVTRCAAEMTELANELGCDTSDVRRRVKGKDEEIESLRAELAALQRHAHEIVEGVPRTSGKGGMSQVWRQMSQDWSTVANNKEREPFQDVESHQPVDQLLRRKGSGRNVPRTFHEGSAGFSTACSCSGQLCTSIESSRSSLRSDSEKCRRRIRSTSGNHENQVLSALREVLKAQTVADVQKYDGTSSLADFVRAIDVKYPETVWSDSDRRDILINHLEGTAKALVSNLSQEIRQGSFDGLVEELKRARLTPGERLKAASEWKQLRKGDQESVVDFCCRIKEIAKRMYPCQEMDFELGRKLYECLLDWPDSYYMLAALDSPEGRVFDEVRKVALRLERTRDARHVSELETRPGKGLREGGGDISHRNQKDVSKDSDVGALCFECGEAGHFWRRCPKRCAADVASVRKAGKSSFLRKSKTKEKVENETDKRPVQGSFSTHLKSWCCKVERSKRRAPTEAYGRPCYCDVIVFGMKTKALIDTGSVISVTPVGFLKKAQRAGVDLDRMVTIMGDGKEAQVCNASGDPMEFLMRIATEVRVCGAGSATAQFHVQQSSDEVLMLGTNVLGALGIHVKFSPEVGLETKSTGKFRMDAETPSERILTIQREAKKSLIEPTPARRRRRRKKAEAVSPDLRAQSDSRSTSQMECRCHMTTFRERRSGENGCSTSDRRLRQERKFQGEPMTVFNELVRDHRATDPSCLPRLG